MSHEKRFLFSRQPRRYRHAKQELQNVLEEHLGEAREKYFYLLNHTEEIDKILAYGKEKARVKSKAMMEKVRALLGTY